MLIQLLLFSFGPSRTAAKVISYIIQQNYTQFWKTFGEVSEKEPWFRQFKV